ncbi:MAG: hypothetical protein H6R00_3892 [Proteobacteria bacterium]|nr:hypothetical protein [Pseudomonadota bacterium]
MADAPFGAAGVAEQAGGGEEEQAPAAAPQRGDGNAKVRIERCGSDLCATNTWIREGTKDEKAGDVLVMSVKADDPSHWSGTAFDRQRDLRYRMTLTIGDKQMTSRGCVLAGLVCKNMDWTRLAGK